MQKPKNTYTCSDGAFLVITEYDSPARVGRASAQDEPHLCRRFAVSWYLLDENVGEYGTSLGEGHLFGSTEIPKDITEWEFWTAERAIAKEFRIQFDEAVHGPFLFDTRSEAERALEVANKALHEGIGRPWPQWALQAKKAGWTPPKGWEPGVDNPACLDQN